MRTLTGTLTAPDGSPLSGTLTLIAIHNVNTVPSQSVTSVDLDEAGGYTFDVVEGFYSFHFKPAGGREYVLGRAPVPSGEPVSVLTLLEAPNLGNPDPAEVLLEAIKGSAQSAEQDAATATAAAQTATEQAGVATQAADRATDPATSLQMLLDSANGDGVTAAYDILVRDTLRREAEARSGGRVTVLYDSHGNPNWMHVLPKFRYEDLGYGTEFGTGVCTAFLVDGVEKPEIFIGQYQASGNYAQSIADADPATNIDYDDAKAACEAKGAGWHLMTAHEWAAVALWCMANGFEPRGNTNWGRAHDATHEVGRRGDGGLPGDSNGTGRTNTGSGPASWYHTGDHTGIADLVGNVWEWQHGLKFVDGQIICIPDNDYALAESSWLATGHYISNENSTPTLMNEPGIADETSISQNWNSLGKAAGYIESQLLQRLLISPAGIHPQGRFYIRTAGERFPYRGGDWYNGGHAGLAALRAYYPRSNRNSSVGFRPAYIAP